MVEVVVVVVVVLVVVVVYDGGGGGVGGSGGGSGSLRQISVDDVNLSLEPMGGIEEKKRCLARWYGSCPGESVVLSRRRGPASDDRHQPSSRPDAAVGRVA